MFTWLNTHLNKFSRINKSQVLSMQTNATGELFILFYVSFDYK